MESPAQGGSVQERIRTSWLPAFFAWLSAFFAWLKLPLISVLASLQTYIFPLLRPISFHFCLHFILEFNISVLHTHSLGTTTRRKNSTSWGIKRCGGGWKTTWGKWASQRHGEEMEEGKKRERAFKSLPTQEWGCVWDRSATNLVSKVIIFTVCKIQFCSIHSFIHSSIHPFNKYVWIACCRLSTVAGFM